MALSNQDNNVRVITPINNCRFFKAVFSAKQDNEAFITSVYYKEPDRDVFPTEESYSVAYEIFEKNEKAFAISKSNGLPTRVDADGGKSFQIDLTKSTNDGGTYQSISGRLLNFYTIEDIFKDGKTKQKFIADIFDFKENERYSVELSIAVFGRKFIDKITSLTPEQLRHDIQLSFNRFEIDGKQRATSKVFVLDPESEFGKYEVEGTYEISEWAEGTGYTAKPKGSAKNNKEFLSALENKLESGVDKPFVKFYKRIVEEFQTNIVIPTTQCLFTEMGYDMEIKDKVRTLPVKEDRVEVKTAEVINLTPINKLQSGEKNLVNESIDAPNAENLPF